MNLLDLVAGSSGTTRYAFMALAFAGFFTAFIVAFLGLARHFTTRKELALRLSNGAVRSGQEIDAVLRRKRDALAERQSVWPLAWLSRLAARSGSAWGPVSLLLGAAGMSALTALLAFALSRDAFIALLAAAIGMGLPFLVLAGMRRRRLRQFEAQLPEAIETLVRALKAGHPVSAAIRMVVRELPDPVGTEFAIAADEMNYGLDLEAALGNINARVGQKDFALMVIAIGVQARSGGNLAELLAGMAKVIRDRIRMRLKVKALSAEGRFSALLLSILPFALFGILALVAPQFYGEIWTLPLVKPVLLTATVWMFFGDLIMYRMVNFEI